MSCVHRFVGECAVCGASCELLAKEVARLDGALRATLALLVLGDVSKAQVRLRIETSATIEIGPCRDPWVDVPGADLPK